MRTFLPFFLFILMFLPKDVNAQWEESNGQDSLIAKMGIVRMLTHTVTSSSSARESTRFINTETFFDSLGRTVKSVNDFCKLCGTIIEYDSVTGLVSYKRTVWQTRFVEIYYEYDTKKRRSSIETCYSDSKECELNIFEYDDDNTERLYKIVKRRQIKLDTARHSTRFLRLYSVREAEKELVHEKFFSPEGQLEEIRYYRDGKLQNSLIYEYNHEGRSVRKLDSDGKIYKPPSEVDPLKISTVAKSKYLPTAGGPLLIRKPGIFVLPYEYDVNGLLIKAIIGNSVAEYSYFTD